MAGRWRGRTLVLLALSFLLAGLGVLVWEQFQGSDAELIEAPLLLVGIFLLFDGYLVWRRERMVKDNPK